MVNSKIPIAVTSLPTMPACIVMGLFEMLTILLDILSRSINESETVSLSKLATA